MDLEVEVGEAVLSKVQREVASVLESLKHLDYLLYKYDVKLVER